LFGYQHNANIPVNESSDKMVKESLKLNIPTITVAFGRKKVSLKKLATRNGKEIGMNVKQEDIFKRYST